MTVTLPTKDDGEGAEVRILLSETKGPAFSTYVAVDAKLAMQHMDLVIWNRINNPKPFGLGHPATVGDVLRAKGQFAGFGGYPHYDASIVQRLQSMLNIANAKKDSRSAAFADFIGSAIAVAGAPSISDPSGGVLGSWRTSGSGSPGGSFKFYKTIGGNDFYMIP